MNSRSKGKRGELMWRDVLRSHGYASARRGRQYSGSPESPDVVCEELGRYLFEVKCVQSLNVCEAMERAILDSGPHKQAILAHKKNGKRWLVTMDADTFFDLLGNVADAATPTE